ncbi:MAG: hypothetical protein ACBR21_29545 [Microcoleus sp.]
MAIATKGAMTDLLKKTNSCQKNKKPEKARSDQAVVCWYLERTQS